MTEKVLDLLNKRSEFLTLLDQDISKNEKIYQEISESLKQVESTCEHVKEVGKMPEHSALIPLCKNLYIPGKIIHTGEYLVTTPAHPNSYSILKTLDQTINSLEQNIHDQRKLLERAEIAKNQLIERKNILYYGEEAVQQKFETLDIDSVLEEDGNIENHLLDSDDDEFDNEEERRLEVAKLPKKIYSDKGVALKVGEFFEILEYEVS